MASINERIRRLLKSVRIGRRGSSARRAARQLLRGFDAFGIDLVLDVGANVGQFGQQIRAAGYRGKIVSFEPLSAAHAALRAAAAADPAWTVHERCALGDRDDTVTINIAGNSVSSSLLPMTDKHATAAPGSAYVGQESVPTLRLDAVAPRYLAAAQRAFLKIDTQGYEWQVLNGAEGTLPSLHGVLCELSFVVLYDGQRLWREVVDRLEAAGFTLWGLQPGFMDAAGRNLQVDAIFFRER